MIFTFDGTAWNGQLIGDKCTGAKGYRIVSEYHLYGDKLHSKDQGYDDEGNMKWGSEVTYKYIRMGEWLSGGLTRLHRVGRGFDPLFAHCHFYYGKTY